MFPSPSSWPHASCLRPEPALLSLVPEGQGPEETSPLAEIWGGGRALTPTPRPTAVLVVGPGHLARCQGGGCNNGVGGKKYKSKIK